MLAAALLRAQYPETKARKSLPSDLAYMVGVLHLLNSGDLQACLLRSATGEQNLLLHGSLSCREMLKKWVSELACDHAYNNPIICELRSLCIKCHIPALQCYIDIPYEPLISVVISLMSTPCLWMEYKKNQGQVDVCLN